MLELNTYQFVLWFPEWMGIRFINNATARISCIASIYEWHLFLGFIEIRKWNKSKKCPHNCPNCEVSSKFASVERLAQCEKEG